MGTQRVVAIPPMAGESLRDLVAVLPWGKRVGTALYVHRETVTRCSPALGQWVDALATAAGVGSDFNVLKFVVPANRVSFLSYPDFCEDPHPALRAAITIDLKTGTVMRHDYDPGVNVPILHRKETLLEPTDPRYAPWKALTQAEERHGLYDEPHRIGFRKNWEQRLAEKGLGYEGHRLVPTEKASTDGIPPSEGGSEPGVPVYRHKTALVRYTLSKPIQCLMAHGLLSEKQTLLDYGCGRGDDVRYLKAMGYRAVGWDPVYCPDGPRHPSDIVNLGYVLNVIEEPRERIDVLREAYGLAESLLVVAVLTVGSGAAVSGRPYRDGILTQRNTFQKYFRQQELGTFLEETLEVTAVPAALGVFYVFKNPQEREHFLAQRSRRVFPGIAVDWMGLFKRPGVDRRVAQRARGRSESLYKENEELLEAFWRKTLELGRPPVAGEFDRYGAIEASFGSGKKALRLLTELFGTEALDKAAESRRNDLLVYVALSNFRKRVPLEFLPEGLQADLRFFFGSYSKALARGREALFAAGNPDVVARLCEETPWGHQDHQALYVHSSLVPALHPVLRVYIGCAELLCGEVRDADIVKIHKRSGKLSLLFYDDFFGKPFPELHTRVKVNLRTREVDIFDHRSAVSQELLFFKERYVAPDHPDREGWAATSRTLQDLGLALDKGYGPSKQELLRLAEHHPQLGKMLGDAESVLITQTSPKETGFGGQPSEKLSPFD